MTAARKGAVCRALLVCVLLFAAVTGYAGIDFGAHWDETRILEAVKRTGESGVVVPGWYNYPSASYDLALLSALPELARGARAKLAAADDGAKRAAGAATAEALAAPGFLLRVRTVFLGAVLLSVVWTYGLVSRWRDDPGEALVAAALLAASWEMAYHARWIAPDGILMQLGVLTILAAMSGLDGPDARRAVWLRLAAVTAGIGLGTKYYGGILIAPVLIVALEPLRRIPTEPSRPILREATLLVALFAGAFALTTPAILVAPDQVLLDAGVEAGHYRAGHDGYTVAPGLEHAWLLGQYFARAALSPFQPLALLLGCCAAWGLVVLLRRREERLAVVVLLFAPAFLLVLVSLHRVMIVRNTLLALPFLAILAARGIFDLASRLARPAHRIALGVVVAGALCANLAWLGLAAASIAARDRRDPGGDLVSYLASRPERSVYLSTDARSLLALRSPRLPLAVTPDAARESVFVSRELRELPGWSANHPGRHRIVSGSWEVNLDYYPTWAGDPKLVSIPSDVLRDALGSAPALP